MMVQTPEGGGGGRSIFPCTKFFPAGTYSTVYVKGGYTLLNVCLSYER
jgi:hypothetical protein